MHNRRVMAGDLECRAIKLIPPGLGTGKGSYRPTGDPEGEYGVLGNDGKRPTHVFQPQVLEHQVQIAEETWSLGVKIGLPIAVLLFVFFLVVAFVGAATRPDRGHYDRGLHTGFVWAGVTSALITLGSTLIFMYPLEREYHRWYPVSGTVEQVEKRILPSGDGIKERVLIEIAGKDQYGCDDTRCAGLKEGDLVSLHCKLEWQYTGTDGYSCNYIDSEQNNE